MPKTSAKSSSASAAATSNSSRYVLVVESPAKAKTIQKYLGKQFEVYASYGHVRDLLAKKNSVDPDHDFAMHYVEIEKNAKYVDIIAKAMAKADALYLAPDPDREGEAIAWHLYELLKERKLLDSKPVHRVVFHEITQSAIKNAVEHPRALSMDYVNAQQARRALDFLVGFNLSPLLWKKVQRGLSAGRVQSPALRLIVEREEAIEAFQTREYWTIQAAVEAKKTPFTAKLTRFSGEKVEQFTFTNEEEAMRAKQTLEQAASAGLTVHNVEEKKRQRNPTAPFITSTLQQEAVRKLGFSAQRAMRIAQQLYEGVEVDGASVGLITYMRTDSVQLSKEAVEEMRTYIGEEYGKDYLPPEPRVYKTKSKNAQEAHEAIRPTSIYRTPNSLKGALNADQLKLYTLIWKRALACQMIHATLKTLAIDIACGKPDHLFRATGTTIIHPGFMAVYQEGKDDKEHNATNNNEEAEAEGEALLPALTVGEKVNLDKMLADQHFTEPPPRYTEATLVKALEEFGIGRPSTYASILSTLQARGYVELDQKRFKPTDVGRIVNRFLTLHFTKYVDYDFTAKLEDELDAVSRGEKIWLSLLSEFWKPFIHQVDDVGENVTRKEVTQEALNEACPKCGKELTIRLGKRGRFIGCSGYPDCDYVRNLKSDGEPETPEVLDRPCPECNSPLNIRHGRYGKFIGCSNYPTCKHMEPLQKPKDTEVRCPECHQANLFERKSRYGKPFYGCARYPDCKYAVWYQPLAEVCPKCHWPMMMLKVTKRRGQEKACPQKTCGFVGPYEGEGESGI